MQLMPLSAMSSSLKPAPWGTWRCGVAPRRVPHLPRAVSEPRQPGSNHATGPSPAVMTDATVPEGHKSLHGALYGEGGAEVHSSRKAGYQLIPGEDDGDVLIPVDAYLVHRNDASLLGVYALYDASETLQYVGFSRNMCLAIKGHRSRVGKRLAAHVRAMVVQRTSLQSKAALSAEAQRWIEEADVLPPGNGENRNEWEGTGLDVSLMSEEAREAHLEHKLKFRLAMGESIDEEPATDDDAVRRLKLLKAVEGDDWSAVIDRQTEEVAASHSADLADAATPQSQSSEGGSAHGAAQPPPPIASPFTQAAVHRQVGNQEPQPQIPLNAETVDHALNEVRPFLIADGGNVEVVSVSGGVVSLEFQGACGTCPSSSATMSMGIERCLRATFGTQISQIVQVNAQDTGATEARVDDHLNMLRGAIQSYGGSVVVKSVSEGVCKLLYNGPPAIAVGVRAAVRDQFPDLQEVLLLDSETGAPLKL
ncbi:NFU3 [Auxenochlorella protothecoides x Auxenochlorella symbiontica]